MFDMDSTEESEEEKDVEIVNANGKRLLVQTRDLRTIRGVRARLKEILDTPGDDCIALISPAGEQLEDPIALQNLSGSFWMTAVVIQDPFETKVAQRCGYDSFESLVQSEPNRLKIRGLPHANALLERLPRRLQLLDKLTHIDVNRNVLSSLPSCICQLLTVSKLNIFDNVMTSLPDNFGNLTHLCIFHAGLNNLSSLPVSFDKLSSLAQLSIFTNPMAPMPDVFAGLSGLWWLFADHLPTSLPSHFGEGIVRELDGEAHGLGDGTILWISPSPHRSIDDFVGQAGVE